MNLDKLKKYFIRTTLFFYRYSKSEQLPLNWPSIKDKQLIELKLNSILEICVCCEKTEIVITKSPNNYFGDIEFIGMQDHFKLPNFIIELLFSKNKFKIQLALNLIE